MSEAVISALITGGLALAGVIISNMMAARKTEAAIKINQAVTDTKLEELTREVREHNNFARRMPVVEHDVKDLQRRVSALEKYHQQPVNPIN
jgi:tRNA1(Val) A37 N6-methylase TrmN6